ncbi:MAG TPA: hypothetical protein VG710_01195 [Opitutus sp.]|nr:hypothetical protein [Opitutus sp.]
MTPPASPADDGGGVPSPRDAGSVADQGVRAPIPDASTGLPGFRSWRAVYVVVLGIFVLWVVLLAWLTAHYS